MHLRPEDVQDIVSLLDSLSYDEFDVRTGGLHISLRRAGAEGWTQESRVLSAPTFVTADVAEPAAHEPARQAAQHDDPVPPRLHAIRAPLPGTFYRAPKPGAEPYVDIGSRVDEDTVVGLLETMKLFNSVHANVRGVVVDFLVDDAQPADKETVLLLVEPDGDA
jgi:acetyl-CoA carboxylase biotin carboxyl carrier protein